MPRASDSSRARGEAAAGDDGRGSGDTVATPGRASLAELIGTPSLLGAEGHAGGDDTAVNAGAAELGAPPHGAMARAALWRWGGWGIAYALVALALWWVMHSLYFGPVVSSSERLGCSAGDLEKEAQNTLEYAVGWAPTYLRGSLLVFLAKKLCEKAAGFESRGGLAEGLLGAGGADRAGWVAIVQPSVSAPQPSWTEAREARHLDQRQALSVASLKLMFWHLPQPLAYLGLLYAYRCFVARLGGQLSQPYLAAVVAVRELLYMCSLVFATAKLPVFLLLDLRTVWGESTRLQRFVRLAMYALTPHNYVALCCAARFPAWRRAFLALAATQVVADLSSCFALAALLASTIEQSADATTAGPLRVGYSITAFGFLLFFGPLSVATNLEAAVDQLQHRAIRLARGGAGVVLLLAWGYLMLVIVLLMLEQDVFCPGTKWFNGLANPFSDDPCHEHGECYAAAQCHCEPRFAPESSSSGEALCASCDVCWAGESCSLATVTVAWNQTYPLPPNNTARPCLIPSPTEFQYPSNYTVQPMDASLEFEPAADRWTEGKDELSAAGGDKYEGGVLLPDGRVVLVPWNANHVGLYDGGATRSGATYTVRALSPAVNALLLPYYNKL